MEGQPPKRKFLGGRDGPNKAPKLSAGGGGKMSFAQKMMAKMGHVEGQGLGKEGEGMVNPIEVKLRPQGAGVGTVKEKTQQYKDEQRRAAEKRGEVYEDSSEEERKARRTRKKKSAGGTTSASGTSTPGAARKPKPKYQTVADVQAAAPGLDVPSQMLSSIIDATGVQPKLLTSTAGLLVAGGMLSESEADKIAKRERLELEAFIDAWHGLQEQKIYIDEHEGQMQIELDQKLDEINRLRDVIDAVEKLKVTSSTDISTGEPDLSAQWSSLVVKLEVLQTEHSHDIHRDGLPDAAIGALSPPFKVQMADWVPLESPDYLVSDLRKVKTVLGLDTPEAVPRIVQAGFDDVDAGRSRKPKATTAYESMMYTIWLPKIRTAVTNWNVLDYTPLTSLVHAWRPLLPPFIYSYLMDQLIGPKLGDALRTWEPRRRHHQHKTVSIKYAPPHTWLFPWLPFLPPHQLDARASDGLLVEMKRRLKQVLDGWDVSSGVLPGLLEWRDFLRSELDHVLVRHMLPKLARHMSQRFDVDPSDQDLTPLENVLCWQLHFKPEVLARLLAAEFFPKWLATLHMWLTSDEANYDEIGEWLTWWKQQIPDPIAAHPDVVAGWQKGDRMVNDALDLQDQGRAMRDLPAPAAGPARPVAKELAKKLDATGKSAPRPARDADLVQSFQDVVEAWCAEEDLTMLPLREANPQNGAPLFRITASATGKGGVVVFFQGDLIWAQKRGDRAAYEPMGLDEKLVQRAEGR